MQHLCRGLLLQAALDMPLPAASRGIPSAIRQNIKIEGPEEKEEEDKKQKKGPKAKQGKKGSKVKKNEKKVKKKVKSEMYYVKSEKDAKEKVKSEKDAKENVNGEKENLKSEKDAKENVKSEKDAKEKVKSEKDAEEKVKNPQDSKVQPPEHPKKTKILDHLSESSHLNCSVVLQAPDKIPCTHPAQNSYNFCSLFSPLFTTLGLHFGPCGGTPWQVKKPTEVIMTRKHVYSRAYRKEFTRTGHKSLARRHARQQLQEWLANQ